MLLVPSLRQHLVPLLPSSALLLRTTTSSTTATPRPASTPLLSHYRSLNVQASLVHAGSAIPSASTTPPSGAKSEASKQADRIFAESKPGPQPLV